jgi:hypothetical protein
MRIGDGSNLGIEKFRDLGIKGLKDKIYKLK